MSDQHEQNPSFDDPNTFDGMHAMSADGGDEQAPLSDDHGDHGDHQAAMPVGIGRALPPSAPQELPLLQRAAPVPVAGNGPGHTGSTIAQGMHFTGNATLSGSCSVGGAIEGHLRQAPDRSIAVVVTETGSVKGDITAQRISVMGHTEGVLDAGTGEVTLHERSNVNGIVRYGRIQVNGADLNATLERVVAR